MTKEELIRKSTSELKSMYRERFDDVLPTAFELVSDEQIREAAISSLLFGRRYESNVDGVDRVN